MQCNDDNDVMSIFFDQEYTPILSFALLEVIFDLSLFNLYQKEIL